MTSGRSSQLQTVLVGLDAACLPILNRLSDSGVIPTIDRLMSDGYTDALASQLPPWTPSAWPSLYTGVNPGKHGVFGFLTFDGYDWNVVDRTDVEEFAIWELLDQQGYRSVVVNVPVTHPAREIDGAVVPGYVAPENPDCVPADALSAVDDYRIYPRTGDGTSREQELADYEELVHSRGTVFRDLVETHDPQFGFLQFQQTDTVFHERPDDWEAVERVYAAVDDEISAVLEECDPRNVLIVSDHGMGEYEGYEFRVNDYLRETGHVATKRGGEGMPSWDSIARNKLRDGEEAERPDRRLIERAVAGAAKLGFTSQRIERLLGTLQLADPVADAMPTDVIRAGTEQVDFPNSTAYMRSRIELGIRINVAGRDPDGTVTPDEYETVRESLMSSLADLTTPDGSRVFEAVRPREAVYDGPHVEAAPDIVLVPDGFDHFLSGTLRDERFGAPSEPWNHKPSGVIVAAGPDFEPDAMAGKGRPQLFDVAPTVLSTLGVPPSDRMDGHVLPLVEPVDHHSYPDFNARELRASDSNAVEQHLANLGYLEDV